MKQLLLLLSILLMTPPSYCATQAMTTWMTEVENNIDRNTQDINFNKTNIETNANNIEYQYYKLNQHEEGILKNKDDINNISRQTFQNTHSISNINNRLDNIDGRINSLDDKLESGLATVTALTSLHPNPRAKGRTQIAIGSGMYKDNVAGAVGIFHYINDNVMLSGGAAFGGNDNWAGNVGITFSFGK